MKFLISGIQFSSLFQLLLLFHSKCHGFSVPAPSIPATSPLDPLLTSVLIRENDDDSIKVTAPLESVGGLLNASDGLMVWRQTLLKGRLPIVDDFPITWPPEPLFTPLSTTMGELQLARLVKRHPEVVSAVLLTVLRITMEFSSQTRPNVLNDNDSEEEETIEEEEYYGEDNEFIEPFPDVLIEQPSEETIAEELVSGLIDEWGGVVDGVHALDSIFGFDHGLLNIQDTINHTKSASGFGLQSGVWQHSGWALVPELQRELTAMPELRHLIRELGRRPMVEGSDAVYKFPPREANPQGAEGAQFDPFLPNTVSGLTLSNSFSEMLPSEAMLLKGKESLRRLFLAKKLESKLQSYERSGWLDVPSIPKRTRRRRLPRLRMPSAPGGPIILCLDTSWSMSGTRERLSKAIILACVAAAHKQHRSCRVVAFSNKDGVMETGEITATTEGVSRLLDFLGYSFGGGTDVTGALKHAIEALGTDEMSAADVLLVTDGEIPDPPVSDEMMTDLERLKRQTGMQIHGLLVGKSESIPLEKLCTKTHDFLVGYEEQLSLGNVFGGGSAEARSSLSSVSSSRLSALPCKIDRQLYGFTRWKQQRREYRSRLFARYSDDDGGRTRGKKRKRDRRRNSFDDDDYDLDDDTFIEERVEEVSIRNNDEIAAQNSGAYSYIEKVDRAIVELRNEVNTTLNRRRWSASELDRERNADGSCWRYRGELKTAVNLVGEGLIERDEESRLVVLAMIAEEHILLLGMPGTAKSALGRRLSRLCGGPFFQRLLTKFTTPEEIYGPLSLKALENDEYRRCTEGFLPTASVAFLDEIFKANSAILNTLLTILNERQFDNGAGGRERCPIRCVVGASNEMPESDELDALYDRFLLRKEVFSVSDDGLIQMLALSSPGVSPCDDANDSSQGECDVVFADGLDTVVDSLSTAADDVEMGDDVCFLIRDLRTFMRDDLEVDISDRRLVKASRLLKIVAASNGRRSVDSIDCLLLQHVVWQSPEQQSRVREWLWDHLIPSDTTVAQYRLLLDNIRREASLAVRKTSGDVTGAAGARDLDLAVIQSIRTEVTKVANLIENKSRALERQIEILRRSGDHLWLNPDEARAAVQQLLPKAENLLIATNRVLMDALSLDLCLSDSATVSDDVRVDVIDSLWEDGAGISTSFSEAEMDLTMREAKSKFDVETFRAWKRAQKKAAKQ